MTDPAWTSDPLTPPHGAEWDLVIVGGGTAGIVAARTAAGFGASVLLVERDRPGGDCLWTGCVPSKAMLAAAHSVAGMRAPGPGLHAGHVTVDGPAVLRRVQEAIAAIEPDDSPATLRRAGAAVAHGTARFTGPREITVDGTPVRFRRALLSTGAAPVVPDIPGLRAADPRTSETIWSITELPARLLVVGGGPIGCELGQAFARLGSRVTLVGSAPRLLGREDPDAAALVTAALVADGVDVRTGVALSSVVPDGGAHRADLDDGTEVVADLVLVAVGRHPRTTDLGLAEAGIAVDERGFVRVDAHLRTGNPRVWAAGDLTGYPAFTHTAGVHGTLAATNAVLGLRGTVDTTAIPRVTFTQPEVAAVGVGTSGGPGLTVRTVQHAHVDRAVADGATDGFTRLAFDRRNRVVGATIVGPRAGESLAEAVLAIRQGLRARDIASATHAYPTYGDGVWNAAIAQVRAQLGRPVPRTAVRVLAAVRRRSGR
ncbi:dihydrolipoyl dehydrogenase family protein [Nakamurella flavida]